MHNGKKISLNPIDPKQAMKDAIKRFQASPVSDQKKSNKRKTKRFVFKDKTPVVKTTEIKKAIKTPVISEGEKKNTRHPINLFLDYAIDHMNKDELHTWSLQAKKKNYTVRQWLANGIIGFFRIEDKEYNWKEDT